MKEENFIPGIYNYCDRWCERCSFTDQCYSYQQELKSDFDAEDSTPEGLAEYVGDQLQSVMEMLYEQAESMGIDLDDLPDESPEPATEPLDEIFVETVEKIKDLSIDYAKCTIEWFKENRDLLDDKEKQAYQLLQLGLSDGTATEALKDALEVIAWYMHFIAAKAVRATSGKSPQDYSDPDPVQNDYNGSAKVALGAIEKSMGAWEVVIENLEESTDDIIDILSMLSTLKKDITMLFPKFAQFIRPGFDA